MLKRFIHSMRGPARRLLLLVLGVFTGVLLASQLVIELGAPDHRRDRAAAAASADPADQLWDKRRWLDKAARLLRGGEGLGPTDDIDALLALPRDEVVRRFMNDPRFGDSILDFNLYFLGFKPDQLKSDGVYDRSAFDFANAVASAQAMLQGGDYLALFDLQGPYYMPPLRSLPLEDPPAPDDAGLTIEQLRRKAVGELRATLIGLLEFAGKAKPEAAAELCQRITSVANQSDWWHARVLRAFDDWEGFALVRNSVVTAPLDAMGAAANVECSGKNGAPVDVHVLELAVRTALETYDRTFAEVFSFDPLRYQPHSVKEFRAFDLSALPDQPKWLAFGFEQSQTLGNSSTNANRRRAAYVLKRFFCDDLMPVGAEPPQQHVTGPIAEPSCQACHYKLDPMAGFFRNYGAFFFDFSHGSLIAFDDLAMTDREKYVAAWAGSAAAATRPWNVGYIRSTTVDSANDYGQSIADLSRIIRGSSEPKRCLVKRLFEYAVAEDQAIDGAWLDSLTRRFEAEARENSAAAMRNAIVSVVTSNAFLQADPDPRQCYDEASAGRARNAPPCRIAFILETSCARCHDGVRQSSGRLDLTKWAPVDEGRARAFPHLDAQSRQLSARESLIRILDRLATADPAKRMPRGHPMSSQDRQALYAWAQEELSRLDAGRSP